MQHAIRHVLAAAASVALLAGCRAAAPGAGAPAEMAPANTHAAYGPFAARYELVSRATVNQMSQSRQAALRCFLSLRASRRGDRIGLAITVDSVPELSGDNTSADDAQAAAGLRLMGLLTPTGHVLNLQGGEEVENDVVRQLRTDLERFFPRIPDGGAAPGDTWTDTAHTTRPVLGADIVVHVESVTRSDATEWIALNGMRALHLVRVSNYTFSGAGESMGTEFTIDGTGVRHEHRYLAADSTYLGGTAADTSNAMAYVRAMGMEVPIVRIRSDTVRIAREPR